MKKRQARAPRFMAHARTRESLPTGERRGGARETVRVMTYNSDTVNISLDNLPWYRNLEIKIITSLSVIVIITEKAKVKNPLTREIRGKNYVELYDYTFLYRFD